jgi:Protein of unknown function (DUF3352)
MTARRLWVRSVRFVACFAISFSVMCGLVRAERPTAPRLFPSDTLAYVRVDDSREMQSKMRETTMGRMTDDPQIKPIINEFYSSMSGVLQQVQQVLGVSFEEILSIPNGEVALAVVPTEEDPAICILLEAGDQLPAVEILLSKLEERITEQGAIRKTKKVGNIEIIMYEDPDSRSRQFGYFFDSGVFVACSKVAYIEKQALIWTGNGIDHKSLADNRKFTTIMSQCVGIAGERPHMSFYVDPMAIVRQATKGNSGAALFMTFIPVLGIDGIQGVGGSVILRPKDFDSISHLHLLLASPRKGFLQVMRPKTGDTEPENWVGEDVGTYMTMNWEVARTVGEVGKIVDLFNQEGFFANEVLKRGSTEVGVDLQKDIIDQINDRMSLAQVFIKPVRINSGSNLYCIHLKDGKKFSTDVLPKIYEKLSARSPRWTSSTLSDTVVYSLEIENPSETVRAPQVCFAVSENMLLMSDSKQALTDALLVQQGQKPLLKDSLEFRVVKDRIKEQQKDRDSSIITFQRPEESLRMFYDLAADPKNKDRIKALSENNPVMQALYNALDRHKLPPFEVISKYMSPAGSFVTEDDTGLHQTAFSMRRE